MKNRLFLALFFASVISIISCSNTCRLAKTDDKAVYAVAMTNGSLFFGSISGQDANNLYLKDIYYFKRLDTPNPADPKTARPNLSLVAQVDDFYGPQDEISLNREHVIYYQPLDEDSRVNQLVAQIKAKRATQAAPEIPAAAPPSVPAPAAPAP